MYTRISGDQTGQTIIKACKMDAKTIGGVFLEIGKYDVAPEGTYKVALVMSPTTHDYHWYRQNPDGTWSHKQGQSKATNVDKSYNLIWDPETADRREYTNFIGFFAVKAVDGGMYNDSIATLSSDNISSDNFSLAYDEDAPVLSVEQTAFITKGMSIEDVREQIGIPHNLFGSGIAMDLYKLDNESSLIINYGAERENVCSVIIIDSNGEYSVIVE